MQTGGANVKNNMEFPPKIKNGSVLNPEIPSENTSKEIWSTNLKKYTHHYIHCNVINIYNSQDLGAAQVSIRRWMDQKLWNIYTMKYCSTIRKKEILLFGTVWMDLENLVLSEISQSKKNKYHDSTYMWYLMNKKTNKIETES